METNSKPSLVIVDDEDMVLTSLTAYLQLETDIAVETFSNPEDAVRHLGEHEVDVVIADYLMPRMNGIQLLGRAKAIQPEATRILLTGHADKQSAIDAINEVGLFQYLEKPWDNASLLLIIRSGSERSKLLRSLKHKIAELDEAHSNLQRTQTRLLQAFL